MLDENDKDPYLLNNFGVLYHLSLRNPQKAGYACLYFLLIKFSHEQIDRQSSMRRTLLRLICERNVLCLHSIQRNYAFLLGTDGRDPKSAREHLAIAAALEPASEDCSAMLIMCLLFQESFEEARKEMERALETHPESVPVCHLRSVDPEPTDSSSTSKDATFPRPRHRRGPCNNK
jgi:hypothetical protein